MVEVGSHLLTGPLLFSKPCLAIFFVVLELEPSACPTLSTVSLHPGPRLGLYFISLRTPSSHSTLFQVLASSFHLFKDSNFSVYILGK